MASSGELLAALRRFGLEDDRLDATAARRVHVPMVEFKAMDHLLEAGELTPGQLGDRLALTSGAVTALLDRLERLGWIERSPHPSDRRSVVVRHGNVPSGEAHEIYGPVARRIRQAADRLTPEERDAAVRFLEEAAAAARERADSLKGK